MRVSRFACLSLAWLTVAVSACARPVAPLPVAPAASPTPVPPVSFPRDALPHDVLTEWWYYTGHLSTPEGRPYGFEFTIFQIRRQDTPTAYVAHFALTDVAGQRFLHQARFTQGDPQPMPLDVQGWRLTLGDTITAAMDDGPSLSLRLTDDKPPALHHGGYIDEGPAGGSYYYSRTRLSVSGDLGGTPVRGLAWMDHQWGNFIVPSASLGGWDWYSLQLDDNSELMLYVLRGASTDSPVFGSLVQPDGQVKALDPSIIQAQALGQWTSPHTGAVYPSGWHITWPGHDLVLTPQLEDQELYFPDAPPGSVPAYWEGAVSITGSTTGQGYVELTGYAR